MATLDPDELRDPIPGQSPPPTREHMLAGMGGIIRRLCRFGGPSAVLQMTVGVTRADKLASPIGESPVRLLKATLPAQLLA